MNKPALSLLAGLLGGIVAAGGLLLISQNEDTAPAPMTKPSAFERVIKAQTLRCGYIIAAPGLVKDANTGQLSGLVYDLVTEMGQTLNLKIDWAEETTYATELEGLKTNRYDAICSTLYLRPNIMRDVEFTAPYMYLPIRVVQRKGEDRFKMRTDIDKAEIKIGAVDGTMPALIAQEDFTNAAPYSMPQMSAYSENLLAVMTKKADVTFVDPLVFGSFVQSNPDQLEINADIPPLRVFANILAVQKGEHDLATMLSAATQHLLNNGKVEEIIRKYEPFPSAILRVAPPYTSAQ